MKAAHRRHVWKPSGRTVVRAAPLLLCVGVLWAVGCLNLDLADVPTAPPAPQLSVLTPRQGDTISLSGQVSVTAASVNGIGVVKVLCGELDAGARTVYTWAAPPYLALVDFAQCQDVVLPSPDAGGLPLLPLTVQAISDAGASQFASLEVFFNTVAPVLSVQYAPSAQPHAPFSVLVSSNTALKSFPSVSLNNTPADSVTAVQSTPDGGTYLAFFASTPGLGTDKYPYTPGVPVPIEVLTETQRTVRLTVSATASNGNTTQEDLGVELTRVVWDRYIPGQPASSSATDWAAQPVAYAGGLVLPLATSAPGSSASNWLPGRLEAADGTFDGFDVMLLPGGLADGGYVATGLSAEGATLFAQVQGRFSVLRLVPPPPLSSPVPVATRVGQVTPPLTAVDNLLCLQDSVQACLTGTIESLVCLDPALAAVTAASGLVSTGPPTPGVVAGAGGRYLSPNVMVCGSSWNLVDLLAGTVSFGPLQDPSLDAGSCSITAVSKLVAVGDGTFVVQLTSNCIATAAVPPVVTILRVGANSAILGAYTSPFGTPPPVPHEVVGALRDGRVVTLRNTPPYTLFELWTLNSAVPDVSTPIAGLFDSADATEASVLARSTYAGSDGSFAVLLSGGTFGAAVAAFGPNLQPLWLYLYPRLTSAASARLVSAPGLHDVYLVDEFNNRAVSLRVAPQPQSDAGSPAVSCVGPLITAFDNWDGNAVVNGGTAPTFDTRTLNDAGVPTRYCLISIQNYHWNNGNGATPGSIGLVDVALNKNVSPGPWLALGMSGQGGAPNVDWYFDLTDAGPSGPVVLDGVYRVTDSDPSTWSSDPLNNNVCFSAVYLEQVGP